MQNAISIYQAIHRTTVGVLAAAAALALAACGTSGPSMMTVSSGSSALAVAVAAQGQGSAHLRITASDDMSGAVQAVEHVDVTAFTDSSEQLRIADGTAHATLAARATSLVDLSIKLPSPGGGGGGSSGGSVMVETHEAPTIQSVAISGDGALGGNLSQTLMLSSAGDASIDFTAVPALKIKLSATAATGGGALRFFWLDGTGAAAVEGGADLTASAQAGPRAVVAGSTRVIRAVVQDAKGAAAVVTVELSSAVAATFSSVRATISRAGDAVEKIAACVDAHATCSAQCDVSQSGQNGQMTCLGNCGVQLAVCEGN